MKTITAKPSDIEIEEFATLDEALAFALEDAPPGCVIAVHDDRCALSADDATEETQCTCEPFELVAGAGAGA